MTTIEEHIKNSDKIFEATYSRRYACANDGQKSCWNCKHSSKDPGYGASMYDPGEPAMAECEAPDEVFHKLSEDTYFQWEEAYEEGKFEEDADDCPYYEPMTVVYCDECEQESDLPLYKAPTLGGFDNSFYCCEECYQKAKAKWDKEIAEGWI